MTGDTEFPGRKADSLRKALKAWEARVWDRAGSSICASVLSLKEKQELKVRVQPFTVRRTEQAAKGVCSGFMSYASIPATEIKFINSCEALSTGRGNISAPNRHFWGSFYPVTAKHWPTALVYFFDTKSRYHEILLPSGRNNQPLQI